MKPKAKRPRRVMCPVYLDPDARAAVAELSRITRVPQAVFLREGVDLMLAKYRRTLKRAKP
jgi:hypothetical protein